MKLLHFLFILFIGLSLALNACKSKQEDAPTEEQTTVSPVGTSPEGTTSQDPAATPATASSSNEPHYKCTKPGCTGSGTSQGKCPVCGSDLVHNQAFHAQAGGEQGSSPANPVQVNPTTGNAQPAPPPAKNAKGEFHYKCPNGHDGAATAGNCAKCGTALVHNQAYHQN